MFFFSHFPHQLKCAETSDVRIFTTNINSKMEFIGKQTSRKNVTIEH